MTRRTAQIVLTHHDILHSLSDAGLFNQSTTWEQLIGTPLPIFNNKSLRDLMPSGDLSHLSALHKSGNRIMACYCILNGVGKQTSAFRWQLNSTTLNKMYSGARAAALPARAPTASPFKEDVSKLLTAMRKIKNREGQGKTDEIFNLLFRGKRLEDIIGGRRDFDIARWLQAEPDREPALNQRLMRIIETRAPAADLGIRAPARPRLPSPPAVAGRDDATELLASMQRIKGGASSTKTDDILNLQFKGKRLGDIIVGHRNFDIARWLQAGPDREPAINQRLKRIVEKATPAATPARNDVRAGAGRFSPSPTPPAARGRGAGQVR